MAIQLSKRGVVPNHLFLIDPFAAEVHSNLVPREDGRLMTDLLSDLVHIAGKEAGEKFLPPDGSVQTQVLDAALDWGTDRGLFPAGISRDQFLGLWNIFKRNYRAAISYEPTAYEGQVSLFLGTENPENRSAFWRNLAANSRCLNFTVDHYEMVRKSSARVIAGHISETLEAVRLAGKNSRTDSR